MVVIIMLSWEIATSHRTAMLLAMTVGFDAWSHLFYCAYNYSRIFPQKMQNPRLLSRGFCNQ